MKKYNKPTLNIEELSLVNSIANTPSSLTGTFNEYTEGTGDKVTNFESFWD